MNRLNRTLAASLFFAAAPFTGLADQVILTSPDGTTSISGALVSFDEDAYVLDTVLGTVQVSRALALCEGQACPVIVSGVDLAMATTGPDTSGLLQELLGGFATTRNLSATAGAEEGQISLVNAETSQQSALAAITTGPADASVAQLAAGRIDLYVSTTPAAAYAATGTTLPAQSVERVVALDALVPIVHPSNNVQSVTVENLAQIAAGRIRNWSELGGVDAPIRMLLPPEGSALDQSIDQLILTPNRVRLRGSTERAQNEAQAAAAVLEDANAITVTTLSGRGDAQVLPLLQSCGPLAHASPFAIKAEEYPLSQRIYAHSASEALTPIKAGFLSYISSPEAQDLIGAGRYVSQSIALESVELQGGRMTAAILSATTPETLASVQNFARGVVQAEWLSTTFRFTSASSDLDTKSQTDVQRVVTFLTSDAMAGRDILIVGFSDDVGRFDLNERLALLRATGVRDALVAASGGAVLADRISTSAYGPLAPVGCNDTAKGRESNRRVEVWLR
jgi:phosphate transport system substrate-binding protein